MNQQKTDKEGSVIATLLIIGMAYFLIRTLIAL